MTAFLDSFVHSIQTAWLPQYVPLMVVSILLALWLRKTTPTMVLFTVQMLVAFFLLLIASAVSVGFGSASVARSLHGLAILIFGMLLIRQIGLVCFRLIVPRLGMQPPRILEEIVILMAYGGWVLVRLASAGLDLGSLVASTAVITAILAFAMQDTLGNILSGLALQLDHSVNIGDWIELEGITGEVMQVQWRHTAVRTLFGEMILIPNSQLMKARVMLTGGRTVPRRLRTVFFYCDFDTRPADVMCAIEHSLAYAEIKVIATTPAPVCLITDFSGGLVTYAVRYWLTDPTAPGQADSIVRQHIHAVFQREGWRMAAPGVDLHIASRNARHVSESTLKNQIEARLQTLQEISLFNPLTDDERRDLAQRLKAVHYVEGSRLAQQDEVGDCLFVVVRGQAAVWLETQGRRHLLAELGPGNVIGEMSLMTGEPRRATVTARTDMDCYVLDKAGFQETLQQRPELAEIFAQLLTARSQELTELRENVPTVPTAVEKAAILARIRNIFRV